MISEFSDFYFYNMYIAFEIIYQKIFMYVMRIWNYYMLKKLLLM